MQQMITQGCIHIIDTENIYQREMLIQKITPAEDTQK